jgi:hypothetical protein
VVLPAPEGPMIATRSPLRDAQVDVGEYRVAPEGPRDTLEAEDLRFFRHDSAADADP